MTKRSGPPTGTPLDAVHPSPARPSARDEATDSAARATILVVDDDEDVVTAVRQILEREGYQVAHASNGRAALTALASQRAPDLVLLDLNMPVMDGFELLDVLAAQRSPIPARVVVISGSAKLQDVAHHPRVSACLAKPFEVDELVRIVARFSA